MKALFPLHLLRLPISTIPCSSSISGAKQELHGVRWLGQFWPTSQRSGPCSCDAFKCFERYSLLPALCNQELLSLSLPQPCELIKRKHVPLPWNDCLQWMWSWKTRSLLSIRSIKGFNYRINSLTRENPQAKWILYFYFPILSSFPFSTFNFCTSWQNVKKQ